ncbi:phosphatidylinositol-specific phospholipase C [Nocardiopsis sp. RSe5-2]|uniref:1-phosphatidylinositol phosphodiesterase n=1 Tax=Nocardiopsis endophytica TaxID=3018445 RepID=A0ABT4TYE4_9ACTN|nr:phosphatidylinositol-specific phospholipase C [Nocardiopsis endophytica]MDA2809718.1 phosphatidylinositol-specific phospholipase C [Nocardiopsis endophytica]
MPFTRTGLTTLLSAAVVSALFAPPATASADQADARPSGAAASAWMGGLPDDASLASLSVPGTHDTGAWTGSVWSRTQDMDLSTQLESGVRALDVRTRHYRDAFPIHHGAEYLDLNFTDVVTDTAAFLREHPTETVFMRLKKEHTEEENTRSYEATLDHYIASDPDTAPLLAEHLWRPSGGERVPDLGEVRGKIVILQDFDASKEYGIRWGGSGTDIQDDYRVPTLFDIPEKWEKARDHFERTAAGPPETLYINHLSGSGAPWANPREVATGGPGFRGVNDYARPYLQDSAAGGTLPRTGVVMMDFPDQALIDAVVAHNGPDAAQGA